VGGAVRFKTGRFTPLCTEQKFGWASEPLWTPCSRRQHFVPDEIRVTIPRSSNLSPNDHLTRTLEANLEHVIKFHFRSCVCVIGMFYCLSDPLLARFLPFLVSPPLPSPNPPMTVALLSLSGLYYHLPNTMHINRKMVPFSPQPPSGHAV
jgi:hypothetical protein